MSGSDQKWTLDLDVVPSPHHQRKPSPPKPPTTGNKLEAALNHLIGRQQSMAKPQANHR